MTNPISTNENPLHLFRNWFEYAKAHKGISQANAMILATANKKSRPSTRTVLLKSIESDSLIFYTNYDSKKSQELIENPQVSITFYWDPLFRQVHFVGKASKVSREESEAYWNSRSRNRQLSQWISKQSRPVESWQILKSELLNAEKQFSGQPIPCPTNWGGFRVSLEEVELWQGDDDRLHDRVLFKKSSDGQWAGVRLYP